MSKTSSDPDMASIRSLESSIGRPSLNGESSGGTTKEGLGIRSSKLD